MAGRQRAANEFGNVVDLNRPDPLFARIRAEAEAMSRNEPELASFAYANVLRHKTLEQAVIGRLARRLHHAEVSGDLITHAYMQLLDENPAIGEAFRADILAILDRDPACPRAIEPVLYLKGFHAIQTYRLAHGLLKKGRRELALYLQSRASEVFQCDINPSCKLGTGLFFDHATGIVIGETCVVEDNVSILQSVTLGGTGKETGDRHPKIQYGVLIGAGAKILGNIVIGHCSRVASGSVVLNAVEPNKTVAGVPARVVGNAGCAEPARSMDQILADLPEI